MQNKIERLRELKTMLDEQLISQAEHDKLKAEIISSGPLGFSMGPQTFAVLPQQPPADHLAFRNPTTDQVTMVTRCASFWWTMVFGCFYFAYKGAWLWAGIGIVAALATAGWSWFVFPFFAYRIIVDSYRRNGWIELQPAKAQPATQPAQTLSYLQ